VYYARLMERPKWSKQRLSRWRVLF
jgi:hypothetical protein